MGKDGWDPGADVVDECGAEEGAVLVLMVEEEAEGEGRLEGGKWPKCPLLVLPMPVLLLAGVKGGADPPAIPPPPAAPATAPAGRDRAGSLWNESRGPDLDVDDVAGGVADLGMHGEGGCMGLVRAGGEEDAGRGPLCPPLVYSSPPATPPWKLRGPDLACLCLCCLRCSSPPPSPPPPINPPSHPLPSPGATMRRGPDLARRRFPAAHSHASGVISRSQSSIFMAEENAPPDACPGVWAVLLPPAGPLPPSLDTEAVASLRACIRSAFRPILTPPPPPPAAAMGVLLPPAPTVPPS